MVVWITGLSGSGKSTIANEVYKQLKSENINTVLLDGDIIREALNHSYGYTLEERLKGARQVHGLCKMLENEGMIVVCATMSLFHSIQKLNKEIFTQYLEVFLDVSIDELYKRDKNQLYSRAKNGLEKNVVGIDLISEYPLHPTLHLYNNNLEDKIVNINKIIEQIRLENVK